MAKKVAVFTSKRQLADAVGVSDKTIATWLTREDWPFSRSGPWAERVVSEIATWRQSLQEDRSTAPGESVAKTDQNLAVVEKKAKVRLLVERAELTKSKRRELDGQLVDKEAVESEKIEIFTRLKNLFRIDVKSRLSTEVERRFRAMGRSLSSKEKKVIEDAYLDEVDSAFREISGEA